MPTVVIYGDAGDGQIQSSDLTYALAREGTGATLTANTTNVVNNAGQTAGGGTSFCYECFVAFDTTGIGGASAGELAIAMFGDQSTTNFILESRLDDWGATLTAADFVAGSGLGALPLLATYDSTVVPSDGAYLVFTDVALAGNINAAGFTRMVLASSRHRLANAPAGPEYLQLVLADQAGTIQDPKLTIVATSASPQAQYRPSIDYFMYL